MAFESNLTTSAKTTSLPIDALKNIITHQNGLDWSYVDLPSKMIQNWSNCLVAYNTEHSALAYLIGDVVQKDDWMEAYR